VEEEDPAATAVVEVEDAATEEDAVDRTKDEAAAVDLTDQNPMAVIPLRIRLRTVTRPIPRHSTPTLQKPGVTTAARNRN